MTESYVLRHIAGSHSPQSCLNEQDWQRAEQSQQNWLRREQDEQDYLRARHEILARQQR